MYKKKHGLGKRRASSLTGSYNESNVAVLCQDNFFGGFKYNLVYGAHKKSSNEDDSKTPPKYKTNITKIKKTTSSRKIESKKNKKQVLSKKVKVRTRVSSDMEVMSKNLQCKRTKRRVSLDANAITSAILESDQPSKKKLKFSTESKKSSDEEDSAKKKKVKHNQDLKNLKSFKQKSSNTKSSPRKNQSSQQKNFMTNDQPKTPQKSKSTSKTKKFTPINSTPTKSDSEGKSVTSKSKVKSVDMGCSPITPSLLFPCLEIINNNVTTKSVQNQHSDSFLKKKSNLKNQPKKVLKKDETKSNSVTKKLVKKYESFTSSSSAKKRLFTDSSKNTDTKKSSIDKKTKKVVPIKTKGLKTNSEIKLIKNKEKSKKIKKATNILNSEIKSNKKNYKKPQKEDKVSRPAKRIASLNAQVFLSTYSEDLKRNQRSDKGKARKSNDGNDNTANTFSLVDKVSKDSSSTSQILDNKLTKKATPVKQASKSFKKSKKSPSNTTSTIATSTKLAWSSNSKSIVSTVLSTGYNQTSSNAQINDSTSLASNKLKALVSDSSSSQTSALLVLGSQKKTLTSEKALRTIRPALSSVTSRTEVVTGKQKILTSVKSTSAVVATILPHIPGQICFARQTAPVFPSTNLYNPPIQQSTRPILPHTGFVPHSASVNKFPAYSSILYNTPSNNKMYNIFPHQAHQFANNSTSTATFLFGPSHSPLNFQANQPSFVHSSIPYHPYYSPFNPFFSSIPLSNNKYQSISTPHNHNFFQTYNNNFSSNFSKVNTGTTATNIMETSKAYKPNFVENNSQKKKICKPKQTTTTSNNNLLIPPKVNNNTNVSTGNFVKISPKVTTKLEDKSKLLFKIVPPTSLILPTNPAPATTTTVATLESKQNVFNASNVCHVTPEKIKGIKKNKNKVKPPIHVTPVCSVKIDPILEPPAPRSSATLTSCSVVLIDDIAPKKCVSTLSCQNEKEFSRDKNVKSVKFLWNRRPKRKTVTKRLKALKNVRFEMKSLKRRKNLKAKCRKNVFNKSIKAKGSLTSSSDVKMLKEKGPQKVTESNTMLSCDGSSKQDVVKTDDHVKESDIPSKNLPEQQKTADVVEVSKTTTTTTMRATSNAIEASKSCPLPTLSPKQTTLIKRLEGRKGDSRKVESLKRGVAIVKGCEGGKKDSKISKSGVSKQKTWSWVGQPAMRVVAVQPDGYLMKRVCYPGIRHLDGDLINVRDCVFVRSGSKESDIPYVAKIYALWEEGSEGEMVMGVFWFYRKEHLENVTIASRYQDYEVFASRHRDAVPVACIEDKCYVLPFDHYCRYKGILSRGEWGVKDALNTQIVPSIPNTHKKLSTEEETHEVDVQTSVTPPTSSSSSTTTTTTSTISQNSLQTTTTSLPPSSSNTPVITVDFKKPCSEKSQSKACNFPSTLAYLHYLASEVHKDNIFLCRHTYDIKLKRISKNPHILNLSPCTNNNNNNNNNNNSGGSNVSSNNNGKVISAQNNTDNTQKTINTGNHLMYNNNNIAYDQSYHHQFNFPYNYNHYHNPLLHVPHNSYPHDNIPVNNDKYYHHPVYDVSGYNENNMQATAQHHNKNFDKDVTDEADKVVDGSSSNSVDKVERALESNSEPVNTIVSGLVREESSVSKDCGLIARDDVMAKENNRDDLMDTNENTNLTVNKNNDEVVLANDSVGRIGEKKDGEGCNKDGETPKDDEGADDDDKKLVIDC